MSEMVMDKETAELKSVIGEAIGRIAGGVYVITAHDGKEKVGMLASWVQQAGFQPPSITVAIHKDRELYKVIRNTHTFTVNVLSKSNNDLMKAFSRYSPDQFDKVNYRESQYGMTLVDSVAAMDCRVISWVDVVDHVIVVAEVVNAKMLNTELEPFVHLRKSGFNY